jgi:formiminoglutamase
VDSELKKAVVNDEPTRLGVVKRILMKKKAPILISVPHGGDKIPRELAESCALSPWELFEDADALTREIFDFRDRAAGFADTQIARSLIDLNRNRADFNSQNPDGVIKGKTAHGASVFTNDQFPAIKTIEGVLARYYDPYHKKIDEQLGSDSFKLALDCHSMDPIGPKLGKKPGERRPLFCLSNGGDSSGFPIGKKGYITCSPTLIINFAEILAQTFKISEEEVLLNDPFPGGHIIRSHYSDVVPWIQLEINKRLYITSDKFDKKSLTCFPGVISNLKERIWTAVQKLLNQL